MMFGRVTNSVLCTVLCGKVRTLLAYMFNSNSRPYMVSMRCFLRYFNYLWLGFPMSLFPKAVAALKELVQCPDAGELLARPDLSHYLRRAIEFMQCNKQNELEIKCHNLVYLHVNYNTFRLAFWALSNLLETPAAVEAMQREIDELLETRYNPETNSASLDSVDLDSLKVLGMLQLIQIAAGCASVHEI